MIASLVLGTSLACSTVTKLADSLCSEMGDAQITLKKAREIKHNIVLVIEHSDNSCEGAGRLDDLLFDVDELIWFRTHPHQKTSTR
jgi:hypothetical protein